MTTRYEWQKLKAEWQDYYTCARCKVDYQEITNIGRWECSFHTGKKVSKDESRLVRTSGPNMMSPLFVWSCCGRIWSEDHHLGCTPCDHTEGHYFVTYNGTIEGINGVYLPELAPCDEALEMTSPGVYSIKRRK